MMEKNEDSRSGSGRSQGGRGPRSRRRGGRSGPPGRSHRAPKVAIISRAQGDSLLWAKRIEEYLGAHARTVSRLEVQGDAGLTEILKEARSHGAHRILAVGRAQFVRWAAQAMVGSLMPLAPVLTPGSSPLFGHVPLTAAGWQKHVEQLLRARFIKLDMAMGTVKPFVHQLLAGFPAANGQAGFSTWSALFAHSNLKLRVEVDRVQVEGEFWCMAVANADLDLGSIRWLPGSSWSDQCLDILLVRPRPVWEKWKFLRALRRGEHGGLAGVLRYRGQRITVNAEEPWRYSADGGQIRDAADPLILEARPEMLRLVTPG